MTQHRMSPPGPIWSALDSRDALNPAERAPSEYERKLRMLPTSSLLAEYEAQTNDWAHENYEATRNVTESRREVARRIEYARELATELARLRRIVEELPDYNRARVDAEMRQEGWDVRR